MQFKRPFDQSSLLYSQSDAEPLCGSNLRVVSPSPINVQSHNHVIFCRNIGIPFGAGKLDWLGYQTVKKIEDTFIRFDRIYERDGQTDTA